MAPEYGATCGIFPVDDETLRYLRLSGRSEEHITHRRGVLQGARTLPHREHAGGRVQRSAGTRSRERGAERGRTEASAGPRGSGQRGEFVRRRRCRRWFARERKSSGNGASHVHTGSESIEKGLHHGSVVIAAITSCTNTSNPSVMLGAGLVAKKAVEKGLKTPAWVKTSLAPGSKVVTDYYQKSGLNTYLDQLGFNVVGYGCTTCIGNSGPLPDEVSKVIGEKDLVVASVLSRQSQLRRTYQQRSARQLPDVAAAGGGVRAGRPHRLRSDERPDRCGQRRQRGFLRDIWPTSQEVRRRRRAPASRATCSARPTRMSLRAISAGRDCRCRQARRSRGKTLDLRQEPAVLRGHDEDAEGGRGDQGRARAGHPRAQHHHRSHFAGRIDQEGQPGGKIPDRARREDRRTSTPTARVAATMK